MIQRFYAQGCSPFCVITQVILNVCAIVYPFWFATVLLSMMCRKEDKIAILNQMMQGNPDSDKTILLFCYRILLKMFFQMLFVEVLIDFEEVTACF